MEINLSKPTSIKNIERISNLKKLYKAKSDIKQTMNENQLRALGIQESILKFQKPVIETQKQTAKDIIEVTIEQNKKLRDVLPSKTEKDKMQITINDKLPKSIKPKFFEAKVEEIDNFPIFRIAGDYYFLFPDSDSKTYLRRLDQQTGDGYKFDDTFQAIEATKDFRKVMTGFADEETDKEEIKKYINVIQSSRNKAKVAGAKNSNYFKKLLGLTGTSGYLEGTTSATEGEGLTTVFIPDNPLIMFEELAKLKSAKRAGNNNTFNEASAILKRLLERNIISNKKYKQLLKKFE